MSVNHNKVDSTDRTDNQPNPADFGIEQRIKTAAQESKYILGCSNLDAAQAADYMREQWQDIANSPAKTNTAEPLTAGIVMDGLKAPDNVNLHLIVLDNDDLVEDLMDMILPDNT